MDSFQRAPVARLLTGLVCAITLASCGVVDDDGSSLPDDSTQEFAAFETRGQPVKTKDISGFCQMKTDRGQVPIQEYLASVVSCEAAPGAGLEALKSQAIAARSFALHVNHAQNRALRSSQADQHYDCGRPVLAKARKAVKETAGVVGQYNETLVALFYKAGSESQSSSCRGIGSGATNTEHFITYNAGKQGNAVEGAYDQASSNDNRGDMSQWGAKCLEDKKGKKALDILRFYYGEDIETIQLQGPCVGDTVDPEVLTDGSMCSKESTKPEIVERHQWGARAPNGIRPKHDPYRIAIHHAVSPNNTNKPGAQAVRDIQYGHMYGYHSWSDIGYHFIIDRDGTIYRGNPEDRIGAHVGGNNTGNIGISFLGQYQPPSALGITAGEPTDQQLKSAGRLAGYLAEKYDIELNRQNVKGHREHSGQSTACPGDNLLDDIEKIIEYAGAGILCSRPERPYDEVRKTPDFKLSNAKYRFLKIKAVSPNPVPYPETLGGFEVDSVYYQRGASADAVYASSVKSSSSGAENAQGAVGPPNNNDCDTRSSKAALLPAGDEIVLKFSEPFRPGDSLTIVQGQFGGLEGCDPGYTGRVWGSPDGEKWVLLSSELIGNTSGLSVPTSSVSFLSPRDQANYATGDLTFSVDASPDVQQVEYFVGDKSVGVGTDWEADFPLAHSFRREGTVKITAKALGSDGEPVARDTVEITLDNTFRFSNPRGKRNYGHLPPSHAPKVNFKVSGGPSEIVKVAYEADAYALGESTNTQGFPLTYEFNNSGVRHVFAYGYDAQGDVIATAEIKVTISTEVDAGLEFINPRDGGWYTPNVVLRVRSLNPEIISVEYEIDDGQNVCRSDNPNTDFKCTHKFSDGGWVELTAIGYDTREEFTDEEDREAHKLAEATIKILLTNEDGIVPGSDVDPDADIPLSAGGGSISCDGGTPQGSRKELAQQILNNNNIVLQGNPAMNMQEAASGSPSTAGCGKPAVHLQEGLLAAMVKFGESGGYTVTSITTGCHSPTSNHYRGQALDVGAVGGTLVRPATPGLSFLNACQSCNAKEVLGPHTTPFAFANHDDHIHCAFP